MKNNYLTITGSNLLDPFFSDFSPFFNDNFLKERVRPLEMRTDIKDEGDHYEMIVDIPGVKKENIFLELEDGYLNISAKIEKESNEEEKKNYIHRERFYGSASRSYYVGDVKKESVKAKYENGSLILTLPKVNEEEETRTHQIAID